MKTIQVLYANGNVERFNVKSWQEFFEQHVKNGELNLFGLVSITMVNGYWGLDQ